MRTQASNPYLLALFLTIALASCKKDESEPVDPNGPQITSVSPTSGQMGDRVIITGTNFSKDPASTLIRFGTVLARLDSATSTQLFTRVPKDAERCRIEVSDGRLRGVSPEFFKVYQILPVFGAVGTEPNLFDNLSTQFVRVTSNLEKAGSQSVIQHGHVWNDESVPYLTGNENGPEKDYIHPPSESGFTNLGGIYGNSTDPYRFTSYVKDLKPGTTYQIRAYIVTRQGTYYGPVSEFTTSRKSNF